MPAGALRRTPRRRLPSCCARKTCPRWWGRRRFSARVEFEPISAVFDGVADLRKVFERAGKRREAGARTLLFVDEVHRFNKAQQDGLLPSVEDGTVTLIGATTENPSFALNGARIAAACRGAYWRFPAAGWRGARRVEGDG